MLLNWVSRTRLLILEIILKIKQMFKAVKRLKEWNLQKRKFKKYLVSDSKTKPRDQNCEEMSPLKKRLTIKEIMDIKKNNRL